MSQINWHNYADLLYDASKNNGNATPNYGPYEKLFLSDWGQSKIHNDILQAFHKINISRMKPIQQNSFLYLMNNYNTAMIGFSKGKSVSYLASIFSSIMNNRGDKMDNVDIGPKAVILSNSLGSCTDLENLANILISSAKKENKVKVVAVYASISVQSTIAVICNGCDILIATPTSLLNVLNKTNIITWSNLRYFVFDNTDILLNNYKDQMIYFFKTLKKLKEKTNNLQFISASVKWTKEIDEFLNLLFVKWQYIFGSHLEAARYMKIGFNVVQIKDDKPGQILKYLKNNINCRRCVLIASNADELFKISNFIQQNDSNIKVLSPGEIKSATIYMLQDWNKPLEKSQLVMICSDDNMFDFYIDNADCLIHYDIPVNKETFSIRFSVLQDPNNLFVKKERSTYVFLNSSSKDMLQLPKVVEIMKLFGNSEVQPILQKHAKIINETLEKEKKTCLFCFDMQQFGCCPNPTTCQYRHVLFKELDEPAINIPKSGLAIIKILNIYDASHMSVKLLKLSCTNNLNDGQHWSNVEDHSSTINLKMSSFYSNPNFRILHRNPKFADVVAVELKIKIREHMSTEYYRAIVIDNKIDENTTYPKVKVKLIDLGFVEIVPKLQVFVLPNMLKNVPTTTVDLFLANVKPCDLDKKWCSQADVRIKNEFKFIDICNYTIIVKIKMALGTTIWINKLYTKNWNIKFKKYDFGVILPDVLFNAGYADLNTEHIENFKNLCISADININNINNNDINIIKEEENHEIDIDKFMSLYKLPQPQWAHLDQSSNLVVVEYVISPKIIFVRNFKYLDRCTDLLAMIERYIDQKQVKELEHIVVGAICLAKHPESTKYYRVKIIEIFDSEYVEVLFVDLGHFYHVQKSTLLTIHPNLITQLPFQAIECGLNGVKNTLPITENELDELVVYIMNLTQDSMYFEIVDPVSPAKYTGGNHYEVFLFNENITVNYEFQTNFSQYCDSIQIANTEDSISTSDTNLENDNNCYNERPCVIIESNLCKENDMESDKQLYEAFALAFFGPEMYERLKENGQVIEDINREGSFKTTEEIISVTPVPDKECGEGSADIALAEEIKPVKEIKTIDSATLKIPSTVLKQRKSKNVAGKRKNVCLTCNTNVQSIVPLCNWHQDKNHIYIKLNILELDDFNISYTIEGITFNARFKDTSYNFCAVLYAFIFDRDITYKRSFEGFHIKAEKLYKTDYEWPRLFACRKAHSYLKYDPEHIAINEGIPSLWIRELERLKFIAVGKSLNTAVDDDSHISSSDDDDQKDEQLLLFDDLTEQ